MEDEDFDNNSPIGQLIQRVNKLCKKPQVDEQLSNALDIFQEKVTRQKTYLNNGIFNINFAEAALFLQSCAELYGKKIDLFWDQLLELHTRLIEYDCRDQQEKGKNLNKDVIQQLEERRNRYKRKKKFKLTLAESTTDVDDFLFEKAVEDEEPIPFEADDDLYKAWRRIEWESHEITKIPRAIVIQQRRTYRMKNYYIMKNQDWDIYDEDDGEFNTKYSRIPGWHIIYHLFEYNKLGLLPDKYNTIATLRLCCYLRAQFMRDRKIPFNAPYSQYKEEYIAYKKQFFEEEAKKWQNMPLDTMADLRRQLDYLAQKEREEEGDPPKKTWDIPPFLPKIGCGYAGCTECSEDDKSTITISDSLDKDFDDGFFKEEFTKHELSVNLEKLSSEIVDAKLRQDSGFFDFNDSDISDTSKTEDSGKEITPVNVEGTPNDKTSDTATQNSQDLCETTENTVQTETINPVSEAEKTPEASAEAGKTSEASAEAGKTSEASAEEGKTSEASIETGKASGNPEESATNISGIIENPTETAEAVVVAPSENGAGQCIENENPAETDKDDGFDNQSIMSDHDYCQMPDQTNVLKESKTAKEANNNMVPMNTASRIIPKLVSLKLPKEKRTKDDMGPPPPKIRKLSQKQMIKLMTSKITPVKAMKFEKFFSLNYQPQIGEGDVQTVDYESDDEEIAPEDILAPDDDVRSIVSDHNYSLLPVLPLDNESSMHDSGFVDESVVPAPVNNTESQENNEKGNQDDNTDAELPPENRIVEERREVDPAYQAEYERLLAEVRESRRQLGEELRIDPERLITERQRKEQERLAAKARVQQWRETITPILRNLNENDFDIHEYGGKVMDGLEIEQTKPFKQIVDGKSSAEVVRYFIASLQLANTYNIEICGAKKGELSNDTFGVKLLKKDRYHEHLAEYHAPSEGDFREKLKRIRELQSQEMEQQPEEEPVPKRQRTKNSSKRKAKSQNITPTSSSIQAPSTAAHSETPKSYSGKYIKNSSSSTPNPIKGKNIVPKLAPVILNRDINTPSTSKCFSVSEPSNEEEFCEELASAQNSNPERFSTPQTHKSNRTAEPVGLNVRLLFE